MAGAAGARSERDELASDFMTTRGPRAERRLPTLLPRVLASRPLSSVQPAGPWVQAPLKGNAVGDAHSCAQSLGPLADFSIAIWLERCAQQRRESRPPFCSRRRAGLPSDRQPHSTTPQGPGSINRP
jgi:hypothetical protein